MKLFVVNHKHKLGGSSPMIFLPNAFKGYKKEDMAPIKLTPGEIIDVKADLATQILTRYASCVEAYDPEIHDVKKSTIASKKVNPMKADKQAMAEVKDVK